MPELPEVETVKRTLESRLVGRTFARPIVYWDKLIQGDRVAYLDGVEHKTVTALGRRGKYLMVYLNDDHYLLFHLRMEGKLYIVDKEHHSESHLSMLIPFEDSGEALAFYDVRKFGVTRYLKNSDTAILDKLGPEPMSLSDYGPVYQKIHRNPHPIKEVLMDQTILSGIGNIYADEICFASRISPFSKADTLTRSQVDCLIDNAKKILSAAIENNGSTIRSFRASQSVHGDFQDSLMVYGRQGRECRCCHDFRINVHWLSGRSTHFCPKCQHTGISVAITGKIGSGKSLVTSYFKDDGFITFSADECVHSLYKDKSFLKKLKASFPEVYDKRLAKKKLSRLLVGDRKFKKAYDNFIFREVKKRVETFLIENDGRNKAVEVPLLFDAHMESMFDVLVGTETSHQKDHLIERGDRDIEKRLVFNTINSYDRNRHKLDIILTTDGTKEELRHKVDAVVKELEGRLA